ncbi:GNAT family N-acetyltransferase [Bradyrhizobium sp. sBnM-33]|jgi:ribosomal protein S18 acetylase RimI-like enzyme|uniref:GNAT family N-acetyltransferase n=1 Tax=Bradyrhizobium sp. sBnM-33 TaxID=2831780 RepID=UPI001BCE21FC|nr:GNAT family N-acetyltransferase [Bradyrhizobium sp. sBnM-33]WOH50318.1 GNAT family N-acetyltransferase [Bradyrhizobium sp. sBnM-33]
MAVVQIVPIREAHIESFHRALDFVARERRYLAFLEAPSFESTRAFILNNIKQGYPQLVAVSDGQVIGWCDIVPNPRPIYSHVGVLGIALLPEFRRQGIGGRLMRQTLDAARDFGLRRVELTVRESNAAAIRLYKKFGFEIEGLQRNRILVDGGYENLVLMGMLF